MSHIEIVLAMEYHNPMKILSQLTIIFIVSLMGEAISLVVPFPLPGSIAAMGVMLILLFMRIVKEEQIRETSKYILDNIAIFFIPSCVGMIEHLELLQSSWWKILVVCSVSFFITFIATGYTVKAVLALRRKLNG